MTWGTASKAPPNLNGLIEWIHHRFTLRETRVFERLFRAEPRKSHRIHLHRKRQHLLHRIGNGESTFVLNEAAGCGGSEWEGARRTQGLALRGAVCARARACACVCVCVCCAMLGKGLCSRTSLPECSRGGKTEQVGPQVTCVASWNANGCT